MNSSNTFAWFVLIVLLVSSSLAYRLFPVSSESQDENPLHMKRPMRLAKDLENFKYFLSAWDPVSDGK